MIYIDMLYLEQSNVSESRLKFMLQEFVLNWQASENLIVIKTPPGNTQAVASVIDNAQWAGYWYDCW